MSIDTLPIGQDPVEHAADTRGINYFMARLATQGPAPRERTWPRPRRSPHGGSVRDWADGGRADEYRGGPQLERLLTPEETARNHQGRALARAASAFWSRPEIAALPEAEQQQAYDEFLAAYQSGQDALF